MRMSLAYVLILLILAGACTPSGTEAPPPDDDAAGAIGSALDWDHTPGAELVRIDTAGRTGDPANDLNILPFCVLFGDGHVIWVDPYADPEQTLEDRVDEQTVRAFLEYVIGSGFYSWSSDEGIFIPATDEPDEGPIIERIAVTLYGETHVINALSNWPPDAFANILSRCQRLSAAPVLYVPPGAWVSAVPSEMRSDVPSLPWDVFRASYPDVNLSTMTLENPVWATGDLVHTFWDIARQGRMQITEGNQAYRIVVQVPFLQPYAPPAPPAAGS